MPLDRDSRRTGLIIAGAWTLLGLLESGKGYITDQLRGIERGWAAALVGNMPWWWCWALLTPGIFLLARRLRLDGPGRLPALLGHLAAGLVVAAVHLTVVAVLYWYTITVPALPYLPPATRQQLATPLGQIEAFAGGFLVVDLMTYAAVVLAWYVLEFHRRLAERERAALRLGARAATLEARTQDARLRALRMELQPHFLFNALNATAGLVRRGEGAQAVTMLSRLGALLRLTLDRDLGHEVPLDRELELLELYLDIERTRFSDRLDVRLEVEPAARRALVPAFVLQPLVENAVRHGIARVSGPGRITIGARVRGSRLALEVTDTGPGLGDSDHVKADLANPDFGDSGFDLDVAVAGLAYRDGSPFGRLHAGLSGVGTAPSATAPSVTAPSGAAPSATTARPRTGQGVGLRNTRERLAQLYGSEAGLQLASSAAGGTVATLTLPMRG